MLKYFIWRQEFRDADDYGHPEWGPASIGTEPEKIGEKFSLKEAIDFLREVITSNDENINQTIFSDYTIERRVEVEGLCYDYVITKDEGYNAIKYLITFREDIPNETVIED